MGPVVEAFEVRVATGCPVARPVSTASGPPRQRLRRGPDDFMRRGGGEEKPPQRVHAVFLLDKLSHGLQMMRDRLPDFHDMGLADPAKTAVHKNEAASPHAEVTGEAGFVPRTRRRWRSSRGSSSTTDVYEYAREHYYDQWDGDLLTC